MLQSLSADLCHSHQGSTRILALCEVCSFKAACNIDALNSRNGPYSFAPQQQATRTESLFSVHGLLLIHNDITLNMTTNTYHCHRYFVAWP